MLIATAAEQLYYEGAFTTAFNTMRATHDAGGATALANVPASGASHYQGFMQLLIESGTTSANVRGTASLSVALPTGATSGSATGFMGEAPDDEGDTHLVSYAGTLLLSDGALTAGTGGLATLAITVDGEIDSGLHEFALTGTLSGYLYGTTGNGLRVDGDNDDLEGAIDGDEAASTTLATLWAMQDD